MRTITAGVEQADITPPVGVDLCGYGNRPGPSSGVHDPLMAKALHIADGERHILLLACDLVGLHHDDVASIRREIRDRTGIPAEGIMVGCSHTHAGPATRCIRYLGNPDPDYVEKLHRILIDVAVKAWKASRPARLGRARIPLDIGVNRRRQSDGKTVLAANAGGVTDPHADILFVDTADGAPMARVFLHAAHAVALGGDNTEISADWPGAARHTLQSLVPGVTGLFLQGCCGNINCRERGWEGVRNQGRRAAEAVAAASPVWMPAARVAGVVVPLELPLLPPPSVDEAEALLNAKRLALKHLPPEANRGIRWMAEGTVEWAEKLLAAARGEKPAAKTLPFHVQALGIGDLAFVGLPGEVFVEYALHIADDSPFAQTATASYANGNVGYIPTAAAYDKGGYEVLDAIRFYGLTMPMPDAERHILQTARKALEQAARSVGISAPASQDPERDRK